MAQAVVHVLNRSMSRKKTPTRPVSSCIFDGCIEQREEMTAVGESSQGIELGELLKLVGALSDFGFEYVLLPTGSFLRNG